MANRSYLDTSNISFQEIDEQFISRLEKEEIDKLIDNLEKLIQLYEIEFTALNSQIIYTFNNVVAELYLDGIGNFRGKDAIFKFNFTTRFNRNHALELVCCEKYLRETNMNIERFIVLLLGSGIYREILEEGDRAKTGELSKRGLPPWEDLREGASELLQRGYNLKQKMEKNPESYNIPKFGPCTTCPYHNIEVKFNKKRIICIG